MNYRIIFCLVAIVMLVGTVSADTLIVYPSGTEDGMLNRYVSAGNTFYAIRNGVGVNVDNTTISSTFPITARSSGSTYTYLTREYFEFNTSPLPDSATISSGIISIYTTTGTNGNRLGEPTYSFTMFTPATNGTAVAADYNTFGSTRITNNISWASQNIRRNWTITNLNVISTTGYTNTMLRMSWDIDNSTTGLTWSASNQTNFPVRFSEQSNIIYRPYIYITYTAPPLTSFTSNNTEGTSPLTIQFNDTSLYTPTAWNWSYQNVTGDNIQTWFSTLQNPVYTFTTGNYTIVLNATNDGGSNISTQTTWINVSAGGGSAPVASFTCTKNFLRIPNSVTCTDSSTNTPTSWSWNMGDGSAAKTTQNVTYEFTKRGKWGITLNATNAIGSNVTPAATNVKVVGYENYY
jgi:PKD repeat protein